MVATPMTVAERVRLAPGEWESVAGAVVAAAGAAGSEGFIVARETSVPYVGGGPGSTSA